MRILYLSQYFPPEVGATQNRAYEMARNMVLAGHQVTVITEVPNHPKGIIPPEYRGKLYERDTLDEIEVIRVWVKTSPVKTLRTRLAFYISYMIASILAGLLLARGKYDVIYASSPPLFVGGAALALSFLRRLPMLFEVRDLWPESAIALEKLNNPTAIALGERLEKACYQRAKQIIVVTKGIYNRLIERGYPPEKLTLITNGANIDTFHFKPEAREVIRARLGLQDKFVPIFVGTHGLAQDMETILQAAARLSDYPDIHFLLVGEGPTKAEMMAMAQGMGLTNLTFHPEIPQAQVPEFFSAADIALAPLRRADLFLGALPVKMFDAWACQRPLVLGVDGEARQVLTEAQAGIYVEPENPEAFAAAVLELKNNPTCAQQMGLNGRRIVVEQYSRQAQARQLMDVLKATLPSTN